MALRTALFDVHRELGGQIVEFAGWELPVQYTSVIDEHAAVRQRVGIFDVSHMGQVRISGKGAEELMRWVSTNDIKPAPPGKMIYTHFLDEQGKIIDDIIFGRESADSFFMVPNAATTRRVVEWLAQQNRWGANIDNLSDGLFCFAIQGPKSGATLQKLTPHDLASMKKMWMADTQVAGVRCKLSSTGYTGELGFEVIGPNERAVDVFRAVLDAGKEFDVRPCGLGARDLCRLEKGFLLSGQDFHGDRTTLETGPEWCIKWDHEFVGKEALVGQRASGAYDRLVGVRSTGRGIPRHGYPILAGGRRVGEITSGTMSPILKVGIALGFLPPGLAANGTQLAFEVRGQEVACEVVPTPFV